MSKQTLHTVAAALGVSHVTVSLALSGSPRIAAVTRQRIRDYAASVGYRPNRAAQALKRRSTRTLGFVLPGVASLFHACLADHLYRAAAEAGYLLQIVFSGYDPDSERRAIEECMALPVDGLMLSSSTPSEWQPAGEAHPLFHVPAGFPLVASGSSQECGGRQVPAFGFDHRRSFTELTCWMVEQGCRTLFLLLNVSDSEIDACGHLENQGVKERIAASRSALGDMGASDVRLEAVQIVHPFERMHVRPGAGALGDPQQLDADERTLALESLRPLLDGPALRQGRVGLLAMNDQVAAVAQKECVRRGLELGRDVVIAGCDDTLGPWMGFTSYRWDYPLYARSIVQGLLAQMNGEPLPASPPIGGQLMVRV